MSLYTVILFLHVVGAIGYFLGTGLYLALSAWSLLTSWILVALISLLLMVPTSAALIAPRRSALVKQLAREAPGGELSRALERRLDDPVLATVFTTVVILLLGLVFLMTTKPNLAGSLIVMVVALLLGLAAGALVSRMRRAPEPGMMNQQVQDKELISSRSGESVQE